MSTPTTTTLTAAAASHGPSSSGLVGELLRPANDFMANRGPPTKLQPRLNEIEMLVDQGPQSHREHVQPQSRHGARGVVSLEEDPLQLSDNMERGGSSNAISELAGRGVLD